VIHAQKQNKTKRERERNLGEIRGGKYPQRQQKLFNVKLLNVNANLKV